MQNSIVTIILGIIFALAIVFVIIPAFFLGMQNSEWILTGVVLLTVAYVAWVILRFLVLAVAGIFGAR